LFKPENFHLNRQGLPLPVELFQVEGEYYVFDVNKVIFLEVTKIIFDVLSVLKKDIDDIDDIVASLPGYSTDDIQNALSEIEEFQSEGYFKPINFQRLNPYTLSDMKDSLSNKLEGVLLNITSRCNLACTYCILSGDYLNHSRLKQQNMSWDVARKAIDFFLSRAREDGCFRVDFFGGEPLLAFPMVKRVVSYLNDKFSQRNQELMIAITSNGTVMTKEIVDFLSENDVLLQFSIDGCKEMHNRNRKFRKSDKGSFDTIIKNLQLISDRNNDYFLNNLRLKAVVTTESIEVEDKDFFDIPVIKALIEKRRFTMLNKIPHYDIEKDQDFFYRIDRLAEFLLKKKDVADIKELLEGLTQKAKNLYSVTLSNFFGVQLTNYFHYEIDEPVPFSKNCLIGFKGAVNPDGSISLCYRADTFPVGNVLEDTWYYDKIAQYDKDKFGIPDCKNCFVQRFCTFCHEKVNTRHNDLETQIQNFCRFTRHYYRLVFEYMLKIMVRNPKLWDQIQVMAEERKNVLIEEQAEREMQKSNKWDK
jgi:uncharacterized protein